MATTDKLSYLLDTKAKIKDAINNDISLIEEDTIFREYPNKINTLSDTLKSYIPTGVKTDSSIQVNDAVPLNVKSLVIDGNSYQKTTKGINLFNYLKNINNVSGLTITTEGDYIVINGTTNNNYQLVIKDIDITDVLEDGEIYTLWQENDAKSPSSDTFPKTAIRLRSKHINGNYIYTRTAGSNTVNFLVNKSNIEKYYIDVVTPVSGEIYSNYKNKFMLAKGEYDESTIPTFEHYTGVIASPNPEHPQEIEFIKNIGLSNNEDEYSVDLQGNFIGKINDVKDTLDLATGILTKKIGKVSFENYDAFSVNSVTEKEVQFLTPSLTGINLSANNIKSNYFSVINGVTSSQKIRFKCPHKLLNISDNSNNTEIKNAFIELMNGKTLEFYYELETPQEIQLEPVKIKMYEGTNNIELTSNLETSMKLEYYKDYKANSEVASEVTE